MKVYLSPVIQGLPRLQAGFSQFWHFSETLSQNRNRHRKILQCNASVAWLRPQVESRTHLKTEGKLITEKKNGLRTGGQAGKSVHCSSRILQFSSQAHIPVSSQLMPKSRTCFCPRNKMKSNRHTASSTLSITER